MNAGRRGGHACPDECDRNICPGMFRFSVRLIDNVAAHWMMVVWFRYAFRQIPVMEWGCVSQGT